MRCSIVTLFPEYFSPLFTTSMIGRAVTQQILKYDFVNPRDFATDAHRSVDDRPYGGGPGMVMKLEPIAAALQSLHVTKGQPQTAIVLLSARGQQLNQSKVVQLSQLQHLVLICGHYGDVDQRVADYLVDLELSVGRFVLSGGEPAAVVLVDAVARLLPGVLGNQASLQNESHQTENYLSPPQYTRPETFGEWSVPKVLLQGDPKQIKTWQLQSQVPHEPSAE